MCDIGFLSTARAKNLRARPAKSSGLISTCNPVHLDPAPSGLHESEECAHQRPSKAALVAKSQAILKAQLSTGPALRAGRVHSLYVYHSRRSGRPETCCSFQDETAPVRKPGASDASACGALNREIQPRYLAAAASQSAKSVVGLEIIRRILQLGDSAS